MPAFIWMHGEGDEGGFYGFPPIFPDTAVKVATEQSVLETSADTLEREVLAKMYSSYTQIHSSESNHWYRPESYRLLK